MKAFTPPVDPAGRSLPTLFPAQSRDGAPWAEPTTTGEIAALQALRNYQRAETDDDLRARLIAWDEIESIIDRFARSEDAGNDYLSDYYTELTHKEVVAVRGIVALWDRLTSVARDQQAQQKEVDTNG